jgi:peptide methionine sulfoxide reductase msrA/msrB
MKLKNTAWALLAGFLSLGASCQAQSNQKKDMADVTGMERAIFASGCFWGTEYFLKRENGVVKSTVGYIGGTLDNPTYREVCSKKTGHYEAVEVYYDPEVTDFETVARMFFETHDPTQKNGQGPDIGPQYRSAIFYLNDEQKATSEKLIKLLQDKGVDVATVLIEAPTFWPAELYHQDYYDLRGGTPYCHGYNKLF